MPLHYLVAKIAAEFAYSKDERSFANHTSRFLRIVNGLEEIISIARRHKEPLTKYCFKNLGIIPLAFFVATKCRLPTIRARAMQILANMPITEGIWNNRVAYLIGKALISLESPSGDMNGMKGKFSIQPTQELIKASGLVSPRLVSARKADCHFDHQKREAKMVVQVRPGVDDPGVSEIRSTLLVLTDEADYDACKAASLVSLMRVHEEILV
jgi:hypothetical protein